MWEFFILRKDSGKRSHSQGDLIQLKNNRQKFDEEEDVGRKEEDDHEAALLSVNICWFEVTMGSDGTQSF